MNTKEKEDLLQMLSDFDKDGKEGRSGRLSVIKGEGDKDFSISVTSEDDGEVEILKCASGELKVCRMYVDDLDVEEICDLILDKYKDLKKAKLVVLYFAPGKKGELRQIEDTLEGMQQLVDGYIEPLYLGDDYVAVCNEEGMINGMTFNRGVYPLGRDGERTGLFGPFFIVDSGWRSFEGTDESELSEYLESAEKSQEILLAMIPKRTK